MKKPLDIIIRPGLVSAIIPIFAALILWILGYIFSPEPNWAVDQSTPFAELLNKLIPSHSGLSHSIGFIFSVIIGIILVKFNEQFLFIRTRTMLPLFFFLLIIGSNINTHEFSFEQISSIFLLLALWQVFSIYQVRNPIKETFNIGFFLAVGSFFTVEILFFLPLFWFGMFRLNSFSLRTFLSSILGFCSPFVIFLGIAYLQSDMVAYINLLITQFSFEFDFFDHNFIYILYIGTISIGALLAIVNHLNYSFNDNIRVSRIIGFISTCFIFSILLFLMMSNKSAIIFTLSTVFTAFLYAHYFSLHYNLFIRILFWIQICISLIFFLSSIFFKY